MGRKQQHLKMERNIARGDRVQFLAYLIWINKDLEKREIHTIQISNHSSTFNLCFVPHSIFPSDKGKSLDFFFPELSGTQFSRTACSEI